MDYDADKHLLLLLAVCVLALLFIFAAAFGV
jgi:hypothetical protein